MYLVHVDAGIHYATAAYKSCADHSALMASTLITAPALTTSPSV